MLFPNGGRYRGVPLYYLYHAAYIPNIVYVLVITVLESLTGNIGTVVMYGPRDLWSYCANISHKAREEHGFV